MATSAKKVAKKAAAPATKKVAAKKAAPAKKVVAKKAVAKAAPAAPTPLKDKFTKASLATHIAERAALVGANAMRDDGAEEDAQAAVGLTLDGETER